EADFDEAAYGYRPTRSALDAVRNVHHTIEEGRTEVVDADLSKYFGAPGEAGRFQRVQFQPRQGEEPPHRESSLGRMEVTTWAKRRQSDVRAVTQVKRLSLVSRSSGGRQGRILGRHQ